LFLGLALYLVETPELPRTIGEILRQSSGQGQPIKEHLQRLMRQRTEGCSHPKGPLSDACVDALMRFLSTSDNTLSSILATLNAPLTVFSDPLVDAATSRDDFSVADVRHRRMTVYVCIPPNRLADARVLLNLFFAQLINLNTAELPEHNPALKHQCLVLLDEFTALGRINILNAAVGYLAGYNLRLVTVIQAVSQLESVYGQHDARTFATNHALQVLYAPREQRDANEYSEMLGTFTQQEKSRGRSNSSGAKGGGSSHSTNESSQRRSLLLPQEFKELGVDREVLILENCKPILADKIRYYTDPAFMARLMPPPELPELDLATHRARVEQRVRIAGDDEEFGLDQIAVDFHGLPHLGADASPEQVQTFVTGFFEALETASAASVASAHSIASAEQQSNLEPARAS
jgi:type IV secretion system protein VirD4